MLQEENVLDEGATIGEEDGGNEDDLGREEVVEGDSKVGVDGGVYSGSIRKRRKRAKARVRVREGGVVEAEKVVEEQDEGVDELLAAFGYKVRFSDMANIAQKLEQLEMALSSTTQDDAFLSHLTSDTVHYNPSNLSNWLESMLSKLNVPPPPISSYTPILNHQSNQLELPPVPITSTSILIRSIALL